MDRARAVQRAQSLISDELWIHSAIAGARYGVVRIVNCGVVYIQNPLDHREEILLDSDRITLIWRGNSITILDTGEVLDADIEDADFLSAEIEVDEVMRESERVCAKLRAEFLAESL